MCLENDYLIKRKKFLIESKRVATEANEMDYLEFEEANSPGKASAKKDASGRGVKPDFEQKPFSLEP